MALGYVSYIELLNKDLTITATDSQFANSTANTIVNVINIKMQNHSIDTKRTVSIYKNTTSVTPLTFLLEPKQFIELTEANLFLANGQSISFKQDIGTDCSVIVSGYREVIA